MALDFFRALVNNLVDVLGDVVDDVWARFVQGR